ncbi:MAG TPA: hypothetical protein VFI87_17390 [Hyphomicrobiaceae bacterium]|jgi:hypothetical protein|nr:hypothetical protein [Hyphomicrobiaceae bacterium]
MSSIGARAISALLLTAALAFLFWLRPGLEPGMLAATPENSMYVFAGIFAVFFVYLVVQGYPISHGNIGSSSAHNLDNMISGIPAIAALFGIFVHFAGFWPLSQLNLLLAVMTMAVVIYDLWVLGGAASKINRLTDEFKAER